MIQSEISDILIWKESELFLDMHRYRTRVQADAAKGKGI